jgi:holo-[acyl-carrier protein] synthase
MIVGLGVDLVEIDRVERALDRWGERFVRKLMDADEAAALPVQGTERVLALARAIAGKEAASKALGTGWTQGVAWRQVALAAGPPPALRLAGRAAEVARARGSSGATRTVLEQRGDLVLAEVRLLA